MSADRPPHDGRRDTHEDEVLELPAAPRELFARIHRALQRHLRPHAAGREGPCLTGGGILEARWDHRESRDIDILIRASTRGDVRETLDTAASEAGRLSGGRAGDRPHRVSRPRERRRMGVTRVAHEWHRRTQHDFGRWRGPLRQEALGANRTARERVRTRRRRTTHDCTGQATTANDDRTNRNRYARSATTPRERLAAVPISTDRHVRRTQSAAAGHATHEPACGRHPIPARTCEPVPTDQRAQVQVNETDAHRARHARLIAGRRRLLAAQRPAPSHRYASAARSRKARRAARDSRVFDIPHRDIARAAMHAGSPIRVAARPQRVGTTIERQPPRAIVEHGSPTC